MSDDDDRRLADLMRGAASEVGALGSSPEGTRRRAQQRRTQRTVVAGAALAVLGVAGGISLLSLDPPSSTLRTATPPSPSASPSSPAPAPSPTASPTASAQQLVLGGDNLGVTQVGAPYASAVAAVAAVLGPPKHDPAKTTGCIGAELEVEWDGFRLAFVDGALAGWSSRDPELRTPSGVGITTSVATLRRTYGDRLSLSPANPDNPESFGVQGVNLLGYLTGLSDADTVTSLFTLVCSGP